MLNKQQVSLWQKLLSKGRVKLTLKLGSYPPSKYTREFLRSLQRARRDMKEGNYLTYEEVFGKQPKIFKKGIVEQIKKSK